MILAFGPSRPVYKAPYVCDYPEEIPQITPPRPEIKPGPEPCIGQTAIIAIMTDK